MNTLSEKLGVAVEADAARYSGGGFVESRGAAITARVRRKRQVRAVGVGGATTLAMGAVVVGGARLPWGGLGSTLALGGADCATEAVTLGTSTMVTSSIAPTGVSAVFSAQTDVVRGSAVVVVPGRASTEDPDASEATPRYIVTYSGGETVEIVNVKGEAIELTWSEDGVASFTGEDGRMVQIVLSPAADVLSVVVGSNEFDSQELVAGPAVTLTPTPSADCVTPEPSQRATADSEPAPSWGGDLPVVPDGVASPFQCGFVFPAPVGSTGVITVGPPTWLDADTAEQRIRAMFDDPASVALATNGSEVPVVEFTTIGNWSDAVYQGQSSAGDPAIQPNFEPSEGIVDGAQFVLEADDTVIATFEHGSAEFQYVDFLGIGNGTMYGLDLTSGFTACPGVDPEYLVDAQAVAVAGTLAVDGEGTIEGPYYAWQYITRA